MRSRGTDDLEGESKGNTEGGNQEAQNNVEDTEEDTTAEVVPTRANVQRTVARPPTYNTPDA